MFTTGSRTFFWKEIVLAWSAWPRTENSEKELKQEDEQEQESEHEI